MEIKEGTIILTGEEFNDYQNYKIAFMQSCIEEAKNDLAEEMRLREKIHYNSYGYDDELECDCECCNEDYDEEDECEDCDVNLYSLVDELNSLQAKLANYNALKIEDGVSKEQLSDFCIAGGPMYDRSNLHSKNHDTIKDFVKSLIEEYDHCEDCDEKESCSLLREMPKSYSEENDSKIKKSDEELHNKDHSLIKDFVKNLVEQDNSCEDCDDKDSCAIGGVRDDIIEYYAKLLEKDSDNKIENYIKELNQFYLDNKDTESQCEDYGETCTLLDNLDNFIESNSEEINNFIKKAVKESTSTSSKITTIKDFVKSLNEKGYDVDISFDKKDENFCEGCANEKICNEDDEVERQSKEENFNSIKLLLKEICKQNGIECEIIENSSFSKDFPSIGGVINIRFKPKKD